MTSGVIFNVVPDSFRTQSRYAVIELELSAVKWTMEKCHLFLKGLPMFTLVVDHQPLVTILDKQTRRGKSQVVAFEGADLGLRF